MHFPNSGSGRPYVRLDARTGMFKASTLDGDPVLVNMSGEVLDLDIENAQQGWLKVDQQGADFVPLTDRDDWNTTPRPSDEYAPAVSLDVMSEVWDAPAVRQFRGSSRAVTTFIAGVANAVGEIPKGKAVRVRIKSVRQIKVGRGTSIDIDFKIAPQDKWPDLAKFDGGGGEPPAQDDSEAWA